MVLNRKIAFTVVTEYAGQEGNLSSEFASGIFNEP